MERAASIPGLGVSEPVNRLEGCLQSEELGNRKEIEVLQIRTWMVLQTGA